MYIYLFCFLRFTSRGMRISVNSTEWGDKGEVGRGGGRGKKENKGAGEKRKRGRNTMNNIL